MSNGVWGRILAHHGEREGDGILGNGPKYDYDFFAFQAGLDVYRREYQDGSRDHAGTYFAVGRGEGDVEHNLLGRRLQGGSDEFDAYTIGGYWTHFGPSGWYLDGVLQGTWYDFTDKAAPPRAAERHRTDSVSPPRSKPAIRSGSAPGSCSSRRRNSSTRRSTSATRMTARR